MKDTLCFIADAKGNIEGHYYFLAYVSKDKNKAKNWDSQQEFIIVKDEEGLKKVFPTKDVYFAIVGE